MSAPAEGTVPTSFDELYPGRFIKSTEFEGQDVTYTIKRVVLEKLYGSKGEELKGVVSFRELDKQWCLNRTNGEALKLMFGAEVPVWLGKRVTLYPQPMKDQFSGEDITGIRVRGSPDITAPMSRDVVRGRKTLKIRVVPTGVSKAAPANVPGKATVPDVPPPPPMSPEETVEFDRVAALCRELAQQLAWPEAKIEGGIKQLRDVAHAKRWFADLEQRVIKQNEAKKE